MSWTLVTGGAKRLGAEICKALAKEGHDVIIHYRESSKEAEETAKQCQSLGVRAECIAGDLSKTESVQAFIKSLQSKYQKEIKSIVHNVGPFVVKPISETNEKEWQELFQANLYAPMAISRALLPSIEKQKGNIIHIGVSGLEGVRANNLFPAYYAAKMALFSATKSLAKELAHKHVRVNMVSPGILENSVGLSLSAINIPFGRFGNPLEVARVVAFLLKEENSYITGQNIEVAGGLGL